MPLAGLERALAQGLKPVFLVIGDATPIRVAALERIRAAALDGLMLAAFNHSTMRLDEGSGQDPLSLARTAPMMGARRVVELRAAQGADNAFWEGLVEYLASPNETTVLIVEGVSFPKVVKGGSNWAARVKKALEPHGLLVDAKLGANDARGFLMAQADALGVRLDGQAASLMVELLGVHADRLSNELEKLALYVGERKRVGPDDVALLCGAVAETEVWGLTTGIAAGDSRASLEVLGRLLNGGDDPRRLLAMLAWKLREVCAADDALARGESADAVGRRHKLPVPAVRRLAGRREAGRALTAARIMGALADANRQMNRHRAGDRRVLEGLVLSLLEG